MTVVLVDNHDSYTWNLAHLVARVHGRLPLVVPNDVGLDVLDLIQPAAVVLSPGPGRPGVARDLGVCAPLLRERPAWPTLGICLGHQALAWASGGRVDRVEPRHGRISRLRHLDRGLFEGLPQGIRVVRYHSLGVLAPLPTTLEACAWSDDDGCIQALQEIGALRFGLQFHPESIASELGGELVARFLARAQVPPAPPHRIPSPPREPDRARVHVRRLELATDPEAAFSALFAGRPGAFWLDSAGRQGDGPSRFSYLGAGDGPEGRTLRWSVREGARTQFVNGSTAWTADLRTALREPLAQLGADADVPFPFVGGWVGWLGYEARSAFSGWPPAGGSGEVPDVHMTFVDRVLVIDHDEGVTWLVALARPGGGDLARSWFNTTTSALQNLPAPTPLSAAPPGSFRATWSRATWLAAIHQAQELIRAGETYEANVTHTLVGPPLPNPLDAYRRLRRANPAPYSAFLSAGSTQVLCSSPEQLVRVGRDRVASARPIKGTAPRSSDPATDRALAAALASSEKERAENLMITDLLRHDLGRVAKPDGVSVPQLFAVEPFATVHHLVSTIEAHLQAGIDVVDVLGVVFPPGSMTGAPKERTVEALAALEAGPRGVYSGAIGWLGVNGCMDMAVVIRTAVCTPRATTVGVGGAITALSSPEAEVDEAWLKAAALQRALWLDTAPTAAWRPGTPET